MPVADCESEHRAVREGADLRPRLLVREARGGGERDANGAGVRDTEDAAACVGSVEADQRRKNPRAQLVVGLAVRPARPPRDVETLGKARLHLVDGEPLPVADVDLAQRLQLRSLEPETSGDDVRGLCCAPERARVDGGQPLVAKGVRELDGLAPARLVERRVRMSLEAALAVPVGLAMTDEDDRRRHAG
jgi:hypothetical protein